MNSFTLTIPLLELDHVGTPSLIFSVFNFFPYLFKFPIAGPILLRRSSLLIYR